MLSALPDTTDLGVLRAAVFARLRGAGWVPSTGEKGRGAQRAESDEALLAALIRGDASAFDALFERHAARLNGYARRRLQPADAADVVQEAFVVLFEKAASILGRGDVNVGGYLFGVLRRKTSKVLAAREHAPAEETERAEATTDDGALAAALLREDEGRLVSLIERACTPLEQEILGATLDDRDGPEVAAELGVTAGHLRVLRHRALAKIRRALEEQQEAS